MSQSGPASAESSAPEAEPPRNRLAFWLIVDFAVPLALAVGLSLWISANGLDLAWQHRLADADGGWSSGETPFWSFLYHFTSIPVVVVCGVAIIGLVAGVRSVTLRRWRRVFWFLILLLVLAPGIVANLVFKEQWGRPRPREITDFGGRYAFEAVFERNPAGDGKSFPCGHATMGFFFVAAYFLLRRRRPLLSLVVLGLALAWGLLIGFMRMLQGGHFATDVIWAGAMTFVTAAFLFHLLGLHRRVLDDGQFAETEGGIHWKARLAGGLAVAGLIGAASFATPYRDTRDYTVLHPEAATLALKPSITLALGDTEVLPGDEFRISGEAWGHGLPTSQIAGRWEETVDGDNLRVKYLQRLSGHLTEVRQDLAITIPWERTLGCKFDLGPGHARIQLPAIESDRKIELRIRETGVEIEVDPRADIVIDSTEIQPEGVRDSRESRPADVGRPRYILLITEWENGSLVIRDPDSAPDESNPR